MFLGTLLFTCSELVQMCTWNDIFKMKSLMIHFSLEDFVPTCRSVQRSLSSSSGLFLGDIFKIFLSLGSIFKIIFYTWKIFSTYSYFWEVHIFKIILFLRNIFKTILSTWSTYLQYHSLPGQYFHVQPVPKGNNFMVVLFLEISSAK